MSVVSYHGDRAPLEEKIENTFRAIKIGGEMSAPVVIINTEKKDEKREEEQFTSVIERFGDFVETAGENGVLVAFEPEPGLVLHGLEETLTLLQEVDSPSLGVNLDIGHSYITDISVVDTIYKLDSKVFHTHIEDIKDKKHKHLLPGDGDIDLQEVITALKNIGYNGSLTFDLFGLGDEYQRYAREALAYLKELT